MSVEEKLREALRAYDRVEPVDGSVKNLQARADAGSRPRRDLRSIAIAFAVVVAVGAIAAARVLSEPDPGALRLVTPTDVTSLLPSPSLASTPSMPVYPSPSPVPVGDKIRYTSADGKWELLYPREWLGPSTAEQSWTLRNASNAGHRLGYPAPDGFTQMKFTIYIPLGHVTLEEVLAEDCKEDPDNEVFECKMVEINGWTWTWVVQYSEEEWPMMILTTRTIVGDKHYIASGSVWGESDYDHVPQMKLIREVVSSFVLNG